MQTVTRVARRARLRPEETLDFGQTVHLRFAEQRYAAFERFEGRSSLSTYLTVVVTRMLIDWRRATEGRRRPAADGTPARPRPRHVSDAYLTNVGTFVDPLDEHERRQISRQVRLAIAGALRRLPQEDRRLIALRYGRRLTVRALAVMLRSDPKVLYRRCDAALRQMRASLEKDGVTPASSRMKCVVTTEAVHKAKWSSAPCRIRS
jgi:RNA polymerase sigma factor (sigma-70 family)